MPLSLLQYIWTLKVSVNSLSGACQPYNLISEIPGITPETTNGFLGLEQSQVFAH